MNSVRMKSVEVAVNTKRGVVVGTSSFSSNVVCHKHVSRMGSVCTG